MLTERLTVPLLSDRDASVQRHRGARQPLRTAARRAAAVSAQAISSSCTGAGDIGSSSWRSVAAGAGAVVAVDVDRARFDVAARLGASHTVDATEHEPYEVVQELTDGALADVTIEASGVPEGMTRVQGLTRRGGTILLVGLPKARVSFDAVDLILREIDVARRWRTCATRTCRRSWSAK